MYNKHSIDKLVVPDEFIYKIFSNICPDTLEILAFDEENHPKNLILKHLPVLPPVSRPFVIADNMCCDDDLTLIYIEIAKCNINLKKCENELKKQKLLFMMKFRIRSLFDNSSEKQKTNSGRPLKSLKKRISGKEGLIRNNLMGKRCDRSGRSVIGPDPTLNIDQVGIPEAIAESLSYPIKVNEYNKKNLQSMIDSDKANYVMKQNTEHPYHDHDFNRINVNYGKYKIEEKILYGDMVFRKKKYLFTVEKEHQKFMVQEKDRIMRNGVFLEENKYFTRKSFNILQNGDMIERKLQDGDFILLNRQPTLHRGSMIALKVKILPAKTIRMNLAITSSYNADFDGDEMNVFNPGSSESMTELQELSSVDNFILNPQSSTSNIVVVQDTALGIYKMTRSKQLLTKHNFMNILSSLKHIDESEYVQKKKVFGNNYNGKFLFSMILPLDFNYCYQNDVDPQDPVFKIVNGNLISGCCTKKDINKIISSLYNEYDINVCKSFIDNVQFLACKYLLFDTFTITLNDCILENRSPIDYSIQKSFLKAKNVIDNIKNPLIQEIYTRYQLLQARDVGLIIAKKAMKKENNFKLCIESGAKGSYANIMQITGLLGQQEVSGERIPNTLNNGKRNLVHNPIHEKDYTEEMKFACRGFIMSSFSIGLDPREYFYHCMVGREGIINTSMSTSTSGYIQRRLVKVMEDMIVNQDGTVRRNGRIVQFHYGNNMDPSQCIVKNNTLLPFVSEKLIKHVNYQQKEK
jgi:DNA-directed RNA polymerase beta' subunit